MARSPSGTIHSVATVLSQKVAITGISNAVDAVVTAPGHGLADGDIARIDSAWGRINGRAFRVKDVDTDTFTLDGADTSSTELFNPGGGAGDVRKAVTWVDLSKTFSHSSSGGDAKTINVHFLEDEMETLISDGFNAVSRTFDIDADEIGNPGYMALKMLSDNDSDTIVRRRAKSGAISLLTCKVSFNEEETLTDGQIVSVKGSFNAQGRSTRYAAPV